MNREYHPGPMSKTDHLRAHDVLMACKLFSLAEARRTWTYSLLAVELDLSVGETHNSVDRCRESGLLLPSREISRDSLRDLLAVAVPRVFIAARGGVGRGLPTSVHAAPLARHFGVAKNALPLVWPDGDQLSAGSRRGEALLPICPSAPAASRLDVVVHELLALADVFRVGCASEQERANELLAERVFGRPRAA